MFWGKLFFFHRFISGEICFPILIPHLSIACPQSYSHYVGLIFFFIILIVLESVSSVESSESIFSIPCLIVEWSFPPSMTPIPFSEVSVILRIRYIAICLGYTISAFLLFPFKSEIDTPKCSETISRISSGVTSLLF